jgi:hypothetical protein
MFRCFKIVKKANFLIFLFDKNLTRYVRMNIKRRTTYKAIKNINNLLRKE